jgi:short-chain fatty acids transporter
MQRFANILKRLLPSPFSIALVLTGITWLLAIVFAKPQEVSITAHTQDVLIYWANGLWSQGLLVFAFQMMLMLILGHVLALSEPIDKVLAKLTKNVRSGAEAAAWVTFLSVAVGLFNWGLALVVGAVFARKIGEFAAANNLKINYAVIGAAGYSGLLVWHGGISGSSLIKVAEPGHLAGMVSADLATELPNRLTFDATVFSTMNLLVSAVLLVALPTVMYLVAKKAKPMGIALETRVNQTKLSIPEGAERLDYSSRFGKLFGIVVLSVVFIFFLQEGFLGYFTPNRINLLLFGLCLVSHKHISGLLQALNEAIGGASGILLQFPLYFGIMGVFNSSGLISLFSETLVNNSSELSFPLFTFLSAAVVNIFVPSGGGQWVVQGPIILEAALALKADLGKSILALAYGDQLTNMLQPFWALPLLGITGLKAKEILPYTLVLLVAGAIIFVSALLFF